MPLPPNDPPPAFDEVWFDDHALLRFADDKDRAQIVEGFRNAVRADQLRARAAELRRSAQSCDQEAAALVDFRDDVLARLKARAQGGGA